MNLKNLFYLIDSFLYKKIALKDRDIIPEFRPVDFIQRGTLEQALDYLSKTDILGFDSETGGFDYFLDPLYTIQLGDALHQFVIDTVTVDVQHFKSLLETKLLIGHNLKFDLKLNSIFSL